MQSEPQTCPECGAPIPPDAPRGLCPKCLLAGAAMTTESGPTNPGRPRPPAPTLAEIAAAFPQLEILDLIGRGGMGFVYRARQPKLERDVAIKVLPRGFASDPRFAERFVREARLLARLNHPNIVAIYDFGEADGFFYLIMELVDGVNLRQAMRASRFTPAQALAIVPAICEALQFAHDEGVLHRDIKPENILLDAKGRVKIADFGIAKLMTDDTATSPPSEEGEDAASRGKTQQPEFGALTENQAIGTPQYMAPEQIAHPAEVDHRADIYSLGVVFYELLTGELPVGEFARPSSRTPLDERVDKIVLRALEKEREFRQQSAREFKTQVETAAQRGGESQPCAGESNNQREQSATLTGVTAGALGITVFFSGLVVGMPLLQALGWLESGIVPLMSVLMIMSTLLLTNVLGFGSISRTVGQERQATSCVRAFAIIGAVVCLPVCGFGVFFFFSVLQEVFTPSGWNPAKSEAVLVPLTVVGAFLLPLCVFRLRTALRGKSRGFQGNPHLRRAGVLCLVLALLLPTLWLAARPRLLDPEQVKLKSQQSLWRAMIEEQQSQIPRLQKTMDSDLLEQAVARLDNYESELRHWEAAEANLPKDHRGRVTESLILGLLFLWIGSLLLRRSMCNTNSRLEPRWAGVASWSLFGLVGLLVTFTLVVAVVRGTTSDSPVGSFRPDPARLNSPPPGGTVSAEAAVELASLAPVVAETFPVSGERDVAPGRTELRVRFSKEMMDESWSWSSAWEGSTPEPVDQPTYDESRLTCSLTVDLEPGRTYAYWLNSQKFSGFQDTQGQPAVPYLLIFQTRATNRNDQPLTTDH